MRITSGVGRPAQKLDILTRPAGIVFHSRKLRSGVRAIAGINELYCDMSVRTETKEASLDTEK